jgi:hypothetical protein
VYALLCVLYQSSTASPRQGTPPVHEPWWPDVNPEYKTGKQRELALPPTIIKPALAVLRKNCHMPSMQIGDMQIKDKLAFKSAHHPPAK